MASVIVAQNDVPLIPSELIMDKPLEHYLHPSAPSATLSGFSACGESWEKQDVVAQFLAEETSKIDHDACAAGEENSFFVADLGEVARAYALWTKHLPQVHAHYAVKCNTDEAVLRVLGDMGANFDCASKSEIDTVLGLGYDASRIVYANPCKTVSYLRHARDVGVALTTVDNRHELAKVKQHHGECQVLIRIVTDDESAQCRLSTKFGCTVDTAINELLPECKRLGLAAVGVAFHVGSGAKDFDSITKAVQDSRVIFDRAEQLGMAMTVLDVGGGFESSSFEQAAATVQQALAQYFPASYSEPRGIRYIAEPGRFLVTEAFTLATHVIGRRDLGVDGMEAMLYINDGVYGNLNCIIFDHQYPEARALKASGETGAAGKYVYSIWGPTCDGLDCVAQQADLGRNVQVGDWIYFPNMGAYTSAATTSFNGFDGRVQVKYI